MGNQHGNGNRRGTGKHDQQAWRLNLDPCERCGANRADVCRTPSGKPRAPHAGRAYSTVSLRLPAHVYEAARTTATANRRRSGTTGATHPLGVLVEAAERVLGDTPGEGTVNGGQTNYMEWEHVGDGPSLNTEVFKTQAGSSGELYAVVLVDSYGDPNETVAMTFVPYPARGSR